MEQKLTISEIEYIYNLADLKTDEELAAMIKKPVALIQMQFALMDGLPNRPWQKDIVIAEVHAEPLTTPINTVKPKSAKKKSVKEKAEKKPISAHAQALDRLKIRKDRCGKSIYATRKLDLTGTIPIKLNERTTVWAAPGTDIDQLKKKYKIA